ncbi:hypothetical protein [Spirosoma sp. KCTC 42546]|uniref:hypothetical protein n=1 Tax=Spirosoma sp. KCTC 42546 TaxID=2520506 RepID=UPI00143D77F7|nr:hypothetical protein [Spirosoma sp. KCTC 42546]
MARFRRENLLVVRRSPAPTPGAIGPSRLVSASAAIWLLTNKTPPRSRFRAIGNRYSAS